MLRKRDAGIGKIGAAHDSTHLSSLLFIFHDSMSGKCDGVKCDNACKHVTLTAAQILMSDGCTYDAIQWCWSLLLS